MYCTSKPKRQGGTAELEVYIRRIHSHLLRIKGQGPDSPSYCQHSTMGGTMDPEAHAKMTRREYRDRYHEQHEELIAKGTPVGIEDVLTDPPSIDMRTIRGTDREVAAAIDRYYANDGR
jgi:hypothetical protein